MSTYRTSSGGNLTTRDIVRLTNNARYRSSSGRLNVVCAAFLGGLVMFAALAALLTRKAPAEPPEFPVWVVLAIVSVAEIPAQLVVVGLLARKLGKIASFDEAVLGGQTLLVMSLAFPESVGVYGLISPFLNAPAGAVWGLIGFAFLHMLITIAVVRPMISETWIACLAREESQRR